MQELVTVRHVSLTPSHSLICSNHTGFERVARAKRARIEATETLTTEAQSGYRHVQRSIASSSRNVEGFTKQVLSESSGLSSATEAYRVSASTHLANLHDATQSLIENGLKEDTPTGLTPRKRRWEYIDEWSLAESREVLMKKWRRQEQSNTKPETFLAEHLPLLHEDDEREDNDHVAEEDAEKEVDDKKADDGENLPPTSSPPTTLSASTSASTSASSTSIPPAPEPIPKRKNSEFLKSGLPTMGTLTERPTNIFVNRRRVLR